MAYDDMTYEDFKRIHCPYVPDSYNGHKDLKSFADSLVLRAQVNMNHPDRIKRREQRKHILTYAEMCAWRRGTIPVSGQWER